MLAIAQPSSTELTTLISEKRARHAQLTDERQALSTRLGTLQDDAARSMAEGRDPDASTNGQIREASEREAMLGRSLNIIDADIGRLQHESAVAVAREAAQDAETRVGEAVDAAERLDTLLRSLADTKVLPAIKALDIAFTLANDARAAAQRHLPSEQRSGVLGDPLPFDVEKRVAPALRLATAVRNFLRDVEQLKLEQQAAA